MVRVEEATDSTMKTKKEDEAVREEHRGEKMHVKKIHLALATA